MKHLFLIVFLLVGSNLLFGQSSKSDEDLRKLADKLAHKYIIVDGHVDLPSRLRVKNFQLTREYLGIPIETDAGDFDYVRAKKGGLDAPFMSIFISAKYQKDGGAKEFADTLINMMEGIAEAHPDKFAIATTPKQVKRNFKKGIISLPMGMENGAPIEDKLENVAYFQKRGIRYITLTHSKDNLICDSSYDTTGTHKGLSLFGRDVVKEMNKVGIMVDISHVSDNTFWQVMDMTDVPCIASHSSCRKFTPGFERNMNDEMIKRMGEEGGVIQINFGSNFLDGEISKNRDRLRAELNSYLKEKGLKRSDEEAKKIIADFNLKHRDEFYADLDIVADHIDNVVKIAGVKHVGFGSDYDGVGDSLPKGLKDVSAYPNLIYTLLKRGYSKKDIKKICYTNVFRVWKQVEKTAKRSS
ncbi:MAG: dipeptidase [Bacteroidetes bacterium]|jgi:membrane dipeptidase|nr:dipeptidase [Bacteroidota bacterium]